MVRAAAQSPCVCTTLRMAARSVTRLYDHALAPTGLSANAYSIVARLIADGELSIGELAGRLAMDRTTLSRELVPLVAGGFLEITPAIVDRRHRLVRVSLAGRTRARMARTAWEEAQADLFAQFGARRTQALQKELWSLLGAEAA